MAHQLQATPDQVLAAISAGAGSLVVLAVSYAAWRWWNRPSVARRRQVARDVRTLERSTR